MEGRKPGTLIWTGDLTVSVPDGTELVSSRSDAQGRREGDEGAFHPSAVARRSPLGRSLVHDHRGFLLVVSLAFVLRVATEAAYRPLLMNISDAWGYLGLAQSFDADRHFTVAPDRPLGYPFLLSLLARPAGFHLGLVTFLQHLAGLGTGVLAYGVLMHLGVRRWLALVCAAVILLDTYSIALAHTIMPEAWFTLGLMAAAVIVAIRPGTPLFFLAGFVLGAVSTLRLAALVAIPVWLLFSTRRYWSQRGLLALALVGLALPIGGYMAAHARATGRMGFADASGFFLYGRVAHLADCRTMNISPRARPLCQPEAERVDNPGIYIWDVCCSPARRMFPGWGATPEEQAANDKLVGGFARATIRSQPWAYLRLVARDFSYAFIPASGKWGSEGSLSLPGSQRHPKTRMAPAEFRTDARFPAPVLHALWYVLRTPRWLLGPLSGLSVLSIALALGRTARRRQRCLPRVGETFLFAGMAMAMLLAAAATAQFGLRYVVAVAPLLCVAGALAIEDLIAGLLPPRPDHRRSALPEGVATT